MLVHYEIHKLVEFVTFPELKSKIIDKKRIDPDEIVVENVPPSYQLYLCVNFVLIYHRLFTFCLSVKSYSFLEIDSFYYGMY